MSEEKLKQLSRGELDKIADSFAVSKEDVKNKTELAVRLIDEGVTYEEYEKMQQALEAQEGTEDTEQAENLQEQVEGPVVEAQPEAADTSETVVEPDPEPTAEPEEQLFLVKMERQNPSYDAVGKTFTSANPFMVCTKAEVDRLMYEHTGFRMATPQEAEEYYN